MLPLLRNHVPQALAQDGKVNYDQDTLQRFDKIGETGVVNEDSSNEEVRHRLFFYMAR